MHPSDVVRCRERLHGILGVWDPDMTMTEFRQCKIKAHFVDVERPIVVHVLLQSGEAPMTCKW